MLARFRLGRHVQLRPPAAQTADVAATTICGRRVARQSKARECGLLRVPSAAEVSADECLQGPGDPVVDSRIGFGGTDNYEVDLEGHKLARAAPFTLNDALSQFLPTGIGSFNWIVQGQTVAKHYFTVYNGEGNLLPPAAGAQYSAPAQSILDAVANGDTAAAQKFTDVVPTYTRFDVGAVTAAPGRLGAPRAQGSDRFAAGRSASG